MENTTSAQPSKGNLYGWISFIVVVLVLGIASFGALREKDQSNNPNRPIDQQNPQPTGLNAVPLAPHTIVYGSWTNQSSEITAIDLSYRKTTTLATLPLNIKKVTILNPTTLMYIDETDKRDHGKKIKIYDIKNKKEKASISADNGFGFDDYVVSPNKQYVALWEVSFAKNSQVLQGGRSRVYVVNLSNPSIKRLLFDDSASSPVHYPRAILDTGKVFVDKFLPGDPSGGTGWAYGMSVVNFDGSEKQELSQMENGTYGTQPILSPDGKSLVFAGYDGSKGPGTQLRNGYRQAVLTPNTIELLDTNSLKRVKLNNIPNNNIYTQVAWGNSANDIILTSISQKREQSGYFSYNTSTNVMTLLKLPDNGQTPYSLLAQLSNNKLLIATTENSPSSVGNLGEGYANLINQLYLFESTDNQASSLRFNGLIQYISTLPQNYFQSVLGIAHAQGGNPGHPNVTIIDFYSDKPAQENLQLKTFLMKPELAPVREKQQTAPPQGDKPRCRDLILEQCRQTNSQDPRCEELYRGNKDAVCYDSPLYLYGTPGEKIDVKIHTPVYNDSPLYKNGYVIKLGEGGVMLVDGRVYSAINYDYKSNLRMLKPPTKGVNLSRSEVENVLRNFAKKLGLNEKETNDLVLVGKKRVTSPYVFVSFYDHDTSTNILPISFNPKPDNYLNVVFYFKLLQEKPNFTPAPPVFPAPLKRSGFTAVEVSEIVE